MKAFDLPINYKASALPMLDSIKNSFTGRVHLPHPYFIENGAHAITFVTHGTEKIEHKEKDRILDMMWIFEKLVRITDQLDEQLHAGYFFYILTSPSKFVSNTVFIWPFVCLGLGMYVPLFLRYLTHENDKTKEIEEAKEAKQKVITPRMSTPIFGLLYVSSIYLMCALFTQIPSMLLKY